MKLEVALPLEPPVFSGVTQGSPATLNVPVLTAEISAVLAGVATVPPLVPAQIAAIQAALLAGITDAAILQGSTAVGIPYTGAMIVAENN